MALPSGSTSDVDKSYHPVPLSFSQRPLAVTSGSGGPVDQIAGTWPHGAFTTGRLNLRFGRSSLSRGEEDRSPSSSRTALDEGSRQERIDRAGAREPMAGFRQNSRTPL